jgi:outer membrane protein TolC
MKRFVVALTIASLPALARADTPKPAPADATSLADVLALAVRQAPELERASIDLETARAVVQRTYGIEDIHLSASGNFTRYVFPGMPTLVEDISSAGVDISRNLPTGGTLHVGGSTEKFGVATPSGGIIYPSGYTTEAHLSLVQPLLRNFGLAIARGPRYQAEHRRDAAALDREARAREVVRALIEAYWRTALAHEELDIRKASLALAEEQLKYTDASIRTGKIPKAELLAVQQVIATRKQDVLAAELAVTDRSLDLRRLAGYEIDANALDLGTSALPKVPSDSLDVAHEVALAMEHSPIIASAEATRAAEQAGADAAANQLLPNLDLSLIAGPLGVGPTFSRSLTSLQSDGGYEVGVSVSTQYNVGRNDEHGLDRVHRAAVLRAKVDVRTARAQVAADTAHAVQAVRAAQLSVELGEQSIELATENVEAEQHRFEDRKSTNFDVLRRQDELQQAKLRHSEAIVDYVSARARLEALTGTILDKYGIKMR